MIQQHGLSMLKGRALIDCMDGILSFQSDYSSRPFLISSSMRCSLVQRKHNTGCVRGNMHVFGMAIDLFRSADLK